MKEPRPPRTTPEQHELPSPLHARMAIAEKDLKDLKDKVSRLEKDFWDAENKMYSASRDAHVAYVRTYRFASVLIAVGAISVVNFAATVYMLTRRK